MRRGRMILLIVLASLTVCGVLGFFAFKHFIQDAIKDKDGMVNTNFVENRPTEGSNLVYCSLWNESEIAEENFQYTLENIGTYIFLNANYVSNDGTRVEINEQNFDPDILSELNTLVLSLDLTEQIVPTSDPNLMDKYSNGYTLRWDDGTVSKPIDGFEKVKEFFVNEVLSRVTSDSKSDKTSLAEIQITIPTIPTVGEKPAIDISVSDDGNNTATMKLWDEDYARNDLLGTVNLNLIDDRTATSSSGIFANDKITNGDWKIDLDLNDYPNTIAFSDYYEDNNGSFTYVLYLHKWGEEWTEDEDSLPYYYSDWYLPLIQNGDPMPDSINK